MPLAQAQDYYLPTPGVMVHLSPPFDPPILKGIKVHPDNPFRFDFILDKGDGELSNGQLKDESSKLIKYFLASLTIPEKDLWVNLSPYEKDRIIPNSFGLTEMGRDLLAEDYMLKQITASLIYPEDTIGKKFWKRIYEEAAKKFGTTNVPVNTFNKVWIVPEKAVVYENTKAGTAYVVESKLKVMLEQDYLSLTKHEGIQSRQTQAKDTNQLGSQIVREIIIPELKKEVNEDKNFAQLRQVYSSLILATWYKKKIKESILSQVYADKNKVAGVNIDNPQEKEEIYQRYLKAFKKGVYNYIKEDVDPVTQETIPRKYFSGGAFLALFQKGDSNLEIPNFEVTSDSHGADGAMLSPDRAMLITEQTERADVENSLAEILKGNKNRKLKAKVGNIIASKVHNDRVTDERIRVMGKILRDFSTKYGIDFENLRPTAKRQLLTVVDKISGETTYAAWGRFISDVENRFGINIQNLDYVQKQRILTAALYVSLAKKVNRNGVMVSQKEEMFDQTIKGIQDSLGISDDDLKKDEKTGGLPLGIKIRLISAAYTGRLETIQEVQNIFALSSNIQVPSSPVVAVEPTMAVKTSTASPIKVPSKPSRRNPSVPFVQSLVQRLFTPKRTLATAIALTLGVSALFMMPQAYAHNKVAPTFENKPPSVSFFQVDSKEGTETVSFAPQPENKIDKPVGAYSDYLPNFTVDQYFKTIAYGRQKGVFSHQALMYYWNHDVPSSTGASNFAVWNVNELNRLRGMGVAPFIGLETIDQKEIDFMVQKFKDAGFDKNDTIYIRVASEPDNMSYGTEDGTPNGKRWTEVAYNAYKKRFEDTSAYLRRLGQENGLNFRIVYTQMNKYGENYRPNLNSFDAFGFDLYLTPLNKDETFDYIKRVSKTYVSKPWVFPEAGIPSSGPYGATPQWAESTLRQTIHLLDENQVKVEQFTYLSVDVRDRVNDRRWDYSLTPPMIRELSLWSQRPQNVGNNYVAQLNNPNYGGIDLTPENMNLQIQYSNGEIKFHLNLVLLKQLQNAHGFIPVIINIQPMRNIRIFLGLTSKSPQQFHNN